MFPNQLVLLCHYTLQTSAFVFTQLIVLKAQMKLWNLPCYCLGWGKKQGYTAESVRAFQIHAQACEKLLTENMRREIRLRLSLPVWNSYLPYSAVQCKSCLPPWFLYNMRMEWPAALWPWCQRGGTGTASGGPGCTSEAPRNTCAHPSEHGGLLIKHRVFMQ